MIENQLLLRVPWLLRGEGWVWEKRKWREQILLSHSKFSGSDTKNGCKQDCCSGKTVLAGKLLLLKSCPLRLQGNLWLRRMGNGRDQDQVFFYSNFLFFIGCFQEWDLSTQRYGDVVTTLRRPSFPCSSN